MNPMEFLQGIKNPQQFVINMMGQNSNPMLGQLMQMAKSGNTNKIINTFNGVGEASRTTGIDARTIYNVCNNKGKTAGGYKWKYESE